MVFFVFLVFREKKKKRKQEKEKTKKKTKDHKSFLDIQKRHFLTFNTGQEILII